MLAAESSDKPYRESLVQLAARGRPTRIAPAARQPNSACLPTGHVATARMCPTAAVRVERDIGRTEGDVREVGGLLHGSLVAGEPPVGFEVEPGRRGIGFGSADEVGGQARSFGLDVNLAGCSGGVVSELVRERVIEQGGHARVVERRDQFGIV